MGYNREDYIKIKAEYSQKHARAWELSEARRFELHARIPAVREIDSVLSGTGGEIMGIIASGKTGTEEKIAALRKRNNELIARRNALLRENGFPEDYSDVKYECEKCSDSGYDSDGRMCECMKKALILASYESSGIGGLIRTQSFDNFSLDYYKTGSGNYDMMQKTVVLLRDFVEKFDKDIYRNYLFVGGTGLGKTHLSTSVAKGVIDKGFDVFYVTAVGMINDFEDKRFGDRFGDTPTKSTDRYYEADLLIIDDLGTEVINQFTLSCLYDVINSRINRRKCTIINTNLNKKEIETKYSERITSRLFGEYNPILFSGTDVRQQKRMK